MASNAKIKIAIAVEYHCHGEKNNKRTHKERIKLKLLNAVGAIIKKSGFMERIYANIIGSKCYTWSMDKVCTSSVNYCILKRNYSLEFLLPCAIK